MTESVLTGTESTLSTFNLETPIIITNIEKSAKYSKQTYRGVPHVIAHYDFTKSVYTELILDQCFKVHKTIRDRGLKYDIYYELHDITADDILCQTFNQVGIMTHINHDTKKIHNFIGISEKGEEKHQVINEDNLFRDFEMN